MTKTELDSSPLMRPADSRAREGCSSLCSPRSGRGTAPALPFLSLLSGNCCANWSYRRLTTKLSAPRPKLSNFLSSSFLPVLCVLSTYFSLFRTSSAYLIGRSHQLTRLWLANLFTTFRLMASHSQACKPDSSWIVEHEINDEHVLIVTTVE